MKISTTCRAALVAASALSILAPTQALAAEVPVCTTENIAYLNSQDKQEDAEAEVATAQRAYDRAKEDREAFNEVRHTAYSLARSFAGVQSPEGQAAFRSADEVYEASERLDASATADAAVAAADAGQKAYDSLNEQEKDEANRRAEESLKGEVPDLIVQLRSEAEVVRKATTAADVDARRTDLDTAVSEKAEADKEVRPARDAYRDCLAKADS
ncbi:hypothetical protein [Streptomyces cyaneofuscatus]